MVGLLVVVLYTYCTSKRKNHCNPKGQQRLKLYMADSFTAIGTLWVLAAKWHSAVWAVGAAIIISLGNNRTGASTISAERTGLAQTVRAVIGFIHSTDLFHFSFLHWTASARGAGQSPAPLPRACRCAYSLVKQYTYAATRATSRNTRKANIILAVIWFYLFAFSL